MVLNADVEAEWPMDIKPILSEKDERAPMLSEVEKNFLKKY